MKLVVLFLVMLVLFAAAAGLGYLAWEHNHMGFGLGCVVFAFLGIATADGLVRACGQPWTS